MTPTEFAVFVESIKDQIVALISGELVPGTAIPDERVPVVLKRLVIDRNTSAWAARLRSPRHIVEVETASGTTQEKQVHAFMIGYGGIETYPDNTVRSVAWKLRFTVDSYYQNTPGTESDNAEKSHGAEIFRVAHVLMTKKPFGVPGVKRVTGFRERRGLAKMGDVDVRESLGEMFIELDPISIPA